MLALLQELVRTNSVNPSLEAGGPGEGAVAAIVEREFRGARFEVRRLEATPGRPSVVVRLPGTGGGRSLMFNAHMDTVGVEGMAEPFAGRVKGGRLYGRGAYDMKGSLAAAIAAMQRMPRLRGDVYLAAVADEEFLSLGTEEVLRHYRPDAAVVTEPTGLDLCVAHKGFAWFEWRVEGRAAHGSRPDLGVDANLAALPVLEQLAALRAELAGRAAHPLLGPPSLHVARVEGGTGWSTYAAGCTIRVERRLVPGETAEQAAAEMPAGARMVFARPFYETKPTGRLVELAQRALPGARLVGQTPWFDSALYAAAGIETLVLGPAGGGAHAAEEWVELESVEAAAEAYVQIAREFCQTEEQR
ncbi:MAG: M20/M25/M40 family metallo-hydrolase [Acidobacteriaceae bacterium]|nr:M20/M25/M40 family metallo-hydrolase [Acidobacteriaceae bacterium]